MGLYRLLERSARLWPRAGAVAIGGGPALSYAQFDARVRSLSGGLRGALGLASGERVAIVSRNCPEYLEVLFACWHAGLVAVPVNAKLHAREIAFILDDCTAAAVFADATHAPAVAGRRHAIELGSDGYRALCAAPAPAAAVAVEDPAWLFYTSGTTGRPKGAVLTHRNLLGMTLAYFADIDRPAPGTGILHAAPMSHGSGLYALAHVAGASLNLIPEGGHFDPDEALALLARGPRMSLFAAPTMVTRMLPRAAGADLRNLRTLIHGGAPMYLADCERAIAVFGTRLFNLYGQGESPMTIAGLPPALYGDAEAPDFHARLASCGPARTGVELRVVDAEDRPLPAGEVGEVVTRSDCVMRGYWGNAQASEAALRGGWLHTGDLGSLDARGLLTLRDRSKDLIISGGSNIYPREVEEVLLRDERVAECAVVGRPHPDWGEEVVAFVVARGADAPPVEALDSLCLGHIARFKRPRAYRFIDALPKNAYGKVLKTELRRLLQG
ncbi:MAG: AMP-binding protein [Gammaproteobacteria bacterium]